MFDAFWERKYYFIFAKCKYNSACQQSAQDAQVPHSPLDMVCNSKTTTTSKPEVNSGLSFKF